MMEMPAEIHDFARSIEDRGFQVWIVGSQVNPPRKPTSDWDLIVFGDQNLNAELADVGPVPRCDLMIVLGNGQFTKPWKGSGGDFLRWQWHQINECQSTYMGAKWSEDQEEWVSNKVAVRFGAQEPPNWPLQPTAGFAGGG